jgi:poly(A) polymerase
MTGTLGLQPWMLTPEVTRLFDALEAEGGVDCARFVGGCVRNTILGRDVDDLDIATRLTPDRVSRAAVAAGGRAVPTGIEHGTVTAVIKGRPFEITTLRRDVSTDGRRAVVAFTEDWGLDSLRRDFTLNTLYASRDGTLHDPTGQGHADALAGRIVFVGEPAARIREDALRIMRFFRFLAWYGQGDADPAALGACRELAGLVTSLPAERTTKELLKLLDAADPRQAVRLMADCGVLDLILTPGGDLDLFDRLAQVETDPALRLCSLLPQTSPAMAAATEHLRLSNEMRARLVAAVGAEPAIQGTMSAAEARAVIYRIGKASFCDRVRLGRARADGDWEALLDLAQAWTVPVLPLTGEDIMRSGVARGPEVGRLLKVVEAWWMAEDFRPDRSQVQARLEATIRGDEA